MTDGPTADHRRQPQPIDFAALSTDMLAAMRAAGAEVTRCQRVLARTGDNVVGELLRGQGKFYEWDHYPKGDVYDRNTHSQFYYHAHPQELRSGEHGHFHTFMRRRGMPAGVQPAAVSGPASPTGPDDPLSHLVAISMDPRGMPVRLFTTNRWVTGEVWYAAADVLAMLDRFGIGLVQPSREVNGWIGAMVRLFRPQIGALVVARDATVAEWAASHPGRDVFEDRELEITSVLDIEVAHQLAAVQAALDARR